jgi:hypothetical protein
LLSSSNSYLDGKDFATSTNQKLTRPTTGTSRRLSASAFPVNNDKTVTVRLRQEPKSIPKIPVLPSQSKD